MKKQTQVIFFEFFILFVGVLFAVFFFFYIVYLAYTFQSINQDLLELLAENENLRESIFKIEETLNKKALEKAAKAMPASKAKTWWSWPFKK